jgi:antitoxin ParD1/3/4
MPTRNINLTPQMDKAVEDWVAGGQYANASEVVRAGLRALEEDEIEQKVKLEALRNAILDGETSGPAADGVFDRVLARIHKIADAENLVG